MSRAGGGGTALLQSGSEGQDVRCVCMLELTLV